LRVEQLEDRLVLSGVSLNVAPNVNTSQLPFSQQEETIAINPTNPSNLFIAANSRNLHDLSTLTPAQFAGYSMNGGKTWKYVDPKDGTVGDGDDALPSANFDTSAAFDKFGNLFWAYAHPNADGTFSVAVVLSTDGGKSFSTVALLQSGKSTDHPILVTGPGPGGSGSSVWVYYDTTSPNQNVVQGASVTGLGVVGPFSPPETVPGAGTGISMGIAVGPSGQVLVSYQDPFGQPTSLGNQTSQSHIFTCLDPDGLGPAGFNPRQHLTSLNISADALIPAQPHQGIDTEAGLVYDRSGGPHSGRAYVVYTDITGKGNDTNIFVRFSDDNGSTWSAPVRVNDDTGTNSQFLPRIALDQTTGYIAVSWYDCRNDQGTGGPGDTDGIPNDEAQFWATVSTDGGLSFAPNVQVSAGTSSANAAWTGVNQDYGDYTGLDYYGGKFYPAWADNSNSTGNNPPVSVNSPPIVGTFRFLDIYTAGVTVTDLVASAVNPPGPTGPIAAFTLASNQAVGGAGGSGANGGNGFGAGIYNDGVSILPSNAGTPATLTISGSTITDNQDACGAAGSDGSAGQGLGGGVYFASGGVVCLDLFTSMNITGNTASTSNDDVFGVFAIC
jgi:hypothetical protein